MKTEESKQNWLGLLVPTVTFLVGLALGGVLVYANSGGGAATEATGQPTVSAAPAGEVNDTVVTVPAACDQAATKVREAYTLLRQAVDQVRDFQADELVGTLNELEDVDGEARGLVSECSELQVSSTPAPTSEATTTGAPSEESSESDPEASPDETP